MEIYLNGGCEYEGKWSKLKQISIYHDSKLMPTFIYFKAIMNIELLLYYFFCVCDLGQFGPPYMRSLSFSCWSVGHILIEIHFATTKGQNYDALDLLMYKSIFLICPLKKINKMEINKTCTFYLGQVSTENWFYKIAFPACRLRKLNKDWTSVQSVVLQPQVFSFSFFHLLVLVHYWIINNFFYI